MEYRKITAEQVGVYGSPVLRLYGRGEDSRRYQFDIHGLPSYFFVSVNPTFPKELESKVKKIESGYHSIFGTPLWKIYTYAPGDTNVLRQQFEEHYEADIHWTERACIDLKITDGFIIGLNGEPKAVKNVDKIKLRTWVLDVEVISPPNIIPDYNTPQYQTACVVVYDSYDDKQYTFSSANTDEKQMWEEFILLISQKDPDIITGWNIGYDISWIIARLSYLNIDPNRLSPMRRAGFRYWTAPDGKTITKFDVAGRIIFDGLEAYKVKKNPSGQLSSYNLHAVAEHEGLEGWEDLGSRIEASWKANPQQVIEYCRSDVKHEKEIIWKERLIDQALRLCGLSGCTMEQTTKKEKIIDHALLLRRGNRILPSKRFRAESEKSKVKGGLVLLPKAGIHKNIGVFDATALYPSIIDGFNISAETKSDKGTIVIKDEENHEFRFLHASVLKGILPEAINEFRQLREDVRLRKYEAERTFGHDSPEYRALEEEDTADKFIITSFYGVNGFAGFRLFDPDCANAITAVGRQIIAGLKQYLTEHGYPVEYGDTDSVFVKIGELQNGSKVSDLITGFLNKRLQAMGVSGTSIKVKFEKYFEWIIFKRRKVKKGVYEAVKKKYVAHMTWSEGQVTDYMYVRGFETRRSDSSPILKQTMEKVFDEMRKGNFDGAIMVLRACKSGYKTRRPMEIGIPRQVHSLNPDITNPWIEGMKNGKEKFKWIYDEQTAPSMLYIKGPMKSICIQQVHILPPEIEIDYDMMFEKTIKKKFEPLLDAMGRYWNVEIEGHTQLDKWFN